MSGNAFAVLGRPGITFCLTEIQGKGSHTIFLMDPASSCPISRGGPIYEFIHLNNLLEYVNIVDEIDDAYLLVVKNMMTTINSLTHQKCHHHLEYLK